MGMADLILAGEGDLYDINEYHMLAHLIMNKVDDFGTILAQSVHEDVVLYILVLCVSYMSQCQNLSNFERSKRKKTNSIKQYSFFMKVTSCF